MSICTVRLKHAPLNDLFLVIALSLVAIMFSDLMLSVYHAEELFMSPM